MRESISADAPDVSHLATFSLPLRGEGHVRHPLWQKDQVMKLASRISAHLQCGRLFVGFIPDVSHLATFTNAASRRTLVNTSAQIKTTQKEFD
jgi:hypothetical protein